MTTAYYVWQNGQQFFSPVNNQWTNIYRFDPVPLISWEKTFERRGDDERLFSTTVVNLSGTIFADIGVNSPSGGTPLQRIDKQQGLLENTFGVDYQNFIIFDDQGYIILSIFPRITSLVFSEGVWAQTSSFTISLEEVEEAETAENIRSGTDSWTITESDNGTVEISHNVSAEGVTTQNQTAFDAAKEWVLAHASSSMPGPYFISLVGSDYNNTKSESTDVRAGTYNITETWIVAERRYSDDRTTETSYERDDLGNFVPTRRISGAITGYAQESNTPENRFASAQIGWAAVSGQIDFGNNAWAVTKSITENPLAGTIGYSIERSTESGVFISRSVSRSFSREDDGSTRQTVVTSAQLRPEAPYEVDYALTWAEANCIPDTSDLPPFASGILVSTGKEIDRWAKSASLTKEWLDNGFVLWNDDWTSEYELTDSSRHQVSVAGTITGLGEESTTSSVDRFQNALLGYENAEDVALVRASGILQRRGISTNLNSSPIEESYGENQRGGVITYSFTFDNHPLLPSGIISEDVSVSTEGGSPIVAQIAVPGRAAGPIMQDMNTKEIMRRTVTVTLQLEPDATEDIGKLRACSVFSLYDPEASEYYTKENYGYNPETHSYTHSRTWEFTWPTDWPGYCAPSGA